MNTTLLYYYIIMMSTSYNLDGRDEQFNIIKGSGGHASHTFKCTKMHFQAYEIRFEYQTMAGLHGSLSWDTNEKKWSSYKSENILPVTV